MLKFNNYNMWGWTKDKSYYLKAMFQTLRSKNFGDIAELRPNNSAEIEETRASNTLQFCPRIWENEYTAQLALRRCIFLSN